MALSAKFSSLCRGESDTYSQVFQKMFETIGRAETVSQANMILDQFNYGKGIFGAYVKTHPHQIESLPSDRAYFFAVFYCQFDKGNLNSAASMKIGILK